MSRGREGTHVTNTVVGELLDAEFSRLAQRDSRPELLRVRGQADFLSLSPGHLSRVRRGEIGVTTKMAQLIAERIRDTPSEQDGLMKQLLSVGAHTRALPTRELMAENFVAEVERFFDGLRGEVCLLCIDYRDFPRSEQRAGRYPNLLESLAKAVREGLVVAMFQPFATEAVTRISIQGLSTYIDLLQAQVRLVHKQLRALVADYPDANRRVVLYEREGTWSGGSGLGSRTMYTERKATTGGYERAVYEWVVGTEYDSFLARDSTQLWPEAFGEQFFPVVDFWRKENRLPTSINELESSLAEDWSVLSASGEKPPIVWTVAPP
jgi:hypothetical protein